MNWGPYRLVRVLHEGGEGTSVLAQTDTEHVVLKWVWRESPIHNQALARLQNAATLNQHLLNIRRVINTGDAQVFVSRYHQGAPLRAILDDDRCDAQTRMLIASQIISGVAGLHKHGLVHGDLRVENIWVTRSGRVLIMDVDQLLLAESSQNRTTKMVALNATTPEHLRAKPISIVSDQFALASLLIELFTGFSPLVMEGQLVQANVLDPKLPDPSVWRFLPTESRDPWLSTLASWWQSSERRRPRPIGELEDLAVVGDERVAARTRLADLANDHAQSMAAEPIAAVVPEFPESEQISPPKSSRKVSMGGAALTLCVVLLAVFVLPSPSISGDMHRRILWVWLDDGGRNAVPNHWKVQLEQRWYKATQPKQGHSKRYSLTWSSQSVAMTLTKPRLKALIECGELFCFFRLKPMQGGRDSWHEQVPVRASLKRWQAVMDRAIAFQQSQLPSE